MTDGFAVFDEIEAFRFGPLVHPQAHQAVDEQQHAEGGRTAVSQRGGNARQLGQHVAPHTAFGDFTAHAFQDEPSQAVHLALVKGAWTPDTSVPVRVHEPLSVLDVLEVGRTMHSWSLDASLRYIAEQGQGVVVLLNCGESAAQLLEQFEGKARAAQAPTRGRMDLRTYGVGAQILRDVGVTRMQLMGAPRRMPSMAGYALEITGYLTPDSKE